MNDLNFAFRQLRKNPGFTAVAVLTLALGIGACTTTFSLVNSVLFRPLPFEDSDRLVWIQNRDQDALSEQASRVDNILDWREQANSFKDIAAYFAFFDLGSDAFAAEGTLQSLSGVKVSQNFLTTLGVRPMLGRNFLVEECVSEGRRVVIISHALWQQQFAGDHGVIGQSVYLNSKATEVVGVLPPNDRLNMIFSPGESLDLLRPFPLSGKVLNWGNTSIAIGRLNEGVSIEQAREELAVISPQLIAAHPEREGYSETSGPVLTLLDDHIRGSFRKAFLLLSCAVVFVWLIACINLANLLLARADARQQEFSMRTALGASHWRLLRQTVTESFVLAGIGCLLGVFVAMLVVSLLTKLQVFDIPFLHEASVDLTALGIAVTMACLAAVVCGVWPTLQQWRRDPGAVLHESSARGNTRRRGAFVRRALVVSEIALACMLLVGAGLLTRSFVKVLEMDLGFASEHLYEWGLKTDRKFDTAEAYIAYHEGLAEHVGKAPGVESVGLSDTVPMGFKRHWPVHPEGIIPREGEDQGGYVRFVDDRALQTLRTPLIRGRYFDSRDHLASEPAVILGQKMADEFWPDQDPLGKLVVANQGVEYSVIGIVSDVSHGLEKTARRDFYLNLAQKKEIKDMGPRLLVRGKGDSDAFVANVRSALREYDASVPSNVHTSLDHVVDQAIAPRRLITSILTAFSIFALLLAAIGLYGLIAYSVGRRTREMGIRLAIGARKIEVLWLVIRDVLKMAGIGVGLGLVGAFFVTRVLQSQLYGVTASDPLTYLVTALILGSVALVAAWMPARRAAKVNPVEALRAD